MNAQKTKDIAKLDSALVKIKVLKRDVHEYQCEVTSLTKNVETSNNH